jgi:hypothetical protein
MSQNRDKRGKGERPSKKAKVDPLLDGENVRLNVEIPKTLRAQVKAWCAIEGREIKDVVKELLAERVLQPRQAIRTHAAELLKRPVPPLVDQLCREFKNLDRARAQRILREEFNNLQMEEFIRVRDDEA